MPDTERGSMRVPGTDGRADKRFALLGRYSSEIRTGCANERPSGSVRGAPGNWCPYRDRLLSNRAAPVSRDEAHQRFAKNSSARRTIVSRNSGVTDTDELGSMLSIRTKLRSSARCRCACRWKMPQTCKYPSDGSTV